jgi:N,N-dimethylformamidase
MRRPVDHAALGAAGYFAELGVAAGTEARFHLSSRDSEIRAHVVRLDRAAEPESTAWPIARIGTPPRVQSLDLGAFLLIRPSDGFLTSTEWALEFEFRLSSAPAGRILVASDAVTLRFAGDGALILEGTTTATGQILPIGAWLNARLCSRRERLSVTVTQAGVEMAALSIDVGSTPGAIGLGGDPAANIPTLNAGIGRIVLRDPTGEVAAAWRFPPVGCPKRLAPIAGEGVLEIHNAPTFGLRSARWDGSVLDPRLGPEHYDALALHDDDLAEADWPETHRIAVLDAAESGVYAVEIATATETTRWPFFVTPKQRQSDLVFLVPTFTYLAYADERLPPARFPWLCDDAGHRFAKANDLTSLYDTHNDGSGVSLASFRRPLATLRDDYRYPLCGAPHLLPVDLHLLRFLQAQGIGIDLLTDADLDRGGLARLESYRGLVTGSHPEYWTGAMRNALDGFRDSGRHIAYLGGNGGYWVTAFDGGTIEVRRGLSGIRTWSSEPGEAHLAMSGEPGGLWRHRDRAEHRLLGVGLQAMGFSRAQPFRRTSDSYAPDLAWLFDGVGDEPIGAAGMVLGGAAGYEIDARSPRWKSPERTRVLAVAEGFDDGYVIDSDATEDGLPAPVRGEMTWAQFGSGSMVFAASSVSWCGALPQSGTMNGVGRITMNLLRRFAR